MDEEIKRKLEEMAHDSSDVGELVYTARGLPVWRVDEDKKLAFMAGAQAAWDLATELAVKAERDRILLESRHKLSHWAHQALIPIILNPPKDEAEK